MYHGRESEMATTDRAGGITAQDLIEAAPDAFVVVNDAGDIVLANTRAEQMFGYQPRELLGQQIELLMPIRHRGAHVGHRADYWQHPRLRRMGDGPELVGLRKDGTEFPVEINLSPLVAASEAFAIAAIRDISERKRAEAERVRLVRERAQIAETKLIRERVLRAKTSDVAREARAHSLRMSYLAQHDPLTDLPNRLLLHDRLDRAFALARRHERQVVVLFVDVDRFKHVNDSLGHAVGDELLQSVAKRLASCVRGSDSVSRYGGDEFIVLLSEVKNARDGAVTAGKIITAVAGVHHLAQHDIHITVSVGVSVYPDDGQDADTLIKNADTAMFRAKAGGRNTYEFFNPEIALPAVDAALAHSEPEPGAHGGRP